MADAAAPFGIWLVDKPPGPTSHDVVALIRRRVGHGIRVGHAGTLDPFATGLLIIAVGRATRLVRYLTDLDKTYLARVRLGATSATGDPEGPVTPTGASLPDASQVAHAVQGFHGAQLQRVPAFAAVKVGGERLYRRARRGEEIEAPSREIEISDARVVAADPGGGWCDLEVTCSKGTYIRQLAADLGDRLGCGGFCEALRRVRVGSLSVEDAVPPAEVPDRGRIDPLDALSTLAVRRLDDRERRDVAHGRPVSGNADGPVALVAGDTLVAVAHPDGSGCLRPKVVLA